MSRLARTNTVLWVEPRLSLRATWRQRGRILSWLPRVEHVRDGLFVFHNPALLPASGPLGIGRLSARLHRALVRHTLQQLGMTRPILWLYLPDMAAIIGQYEERLVIYHVIDEYTSYAGMPSSYIETMRAQEKLLLQQADAVIVTAPALLESKSRFSRSVYLVPNAVDYDGFQHTLAGALLPVEMARLPQPVIGYVGAINDKLDYWLLADLAASRPDWTLAMVGPVDVRTGDDVAGLATLRGRPNVHFLGTVPVEDVPRYIAACQVCLLPYKVNERTRNISSLKLYEYLACGKPVVATDIPAAREAQDCVRIADRDDFVVVVEKALLDDELTAGRRRRLAAANTWDDRVERISAIIAQLLQGHQSKS